MLESDPNRMCVSSHQRDHHILFHRHTVNILNNIRIEEWNDIINYEHETRVILIRIPPNYI